MAVTFKVNGAPVTVDAPTATPLLWIIREQIKLTGTKYGCGTGLCGACTVHIDGNRAFSCQVQLAEVSGRSVTTIEGLSPNSSHPLQKACMRDKVASWWLPDDVTFIDQMPMTATGKIHKLTLRDRFWGYTLPTIEHARASA